MTRGLARSSERLTWRESARNSARSHSLATLVFLQIISLAFIGAGVFILIRDDNRLVGGLSIGFFALCSVGIGRLIIAKLKE